MKKEILGVQAPNKECTDGKCPFHGEINVKQELFTGRVVKKDINRSATIEWNRSIHIKKYERYEKKRSTMRVHNPACIDAEVGQDVVVARTRPISKTKNHVILGVLEKEQEGTEGTKK
jgi:small subunit ribosomal protein S17